MTFEQIYLDNKNTVFNLSLQYVQNIEDAQEITQDVFVKIFESLHNFKHNAKVSTWVYRITINTCLDHIKAKKRKKRIALFTSLFYDDNEVRYEQVHFDHPGVALENKETLQQIFHLINELPFNQRSAMILSKIEHKSQTEIAEILQVSVKAAESLIQRAKSNLMTKLNSFEGNRNKSRLNEHKQ